MIDENTNRQKHQEYDTIVEEWRKLLLNERQTLIMRLGAIEDALGMKRSIIPRHQRHLHATETTGED